MDTTATGELNRLIRETSPYLQQHSRNPVDWYPWGEEALEKAKRENKPIFLSIGYSACHWCHVMEKECFLDKNIARLMNEGFVNIKVDREERPDLDHIYQAAAQLLTGGGGWPLSIFLTPDLRPFYAGTYFPPEDRFGLPGFPQVLDSLRDVFLNEPERVEQAAGQLVSGLAKQSTSISSVSRGKGPPSRDLVRRGAILYGRYADEVNGGFGDRPKFPNAPQLELLFHQHGSPKGSEYVNQATFALRQMASGGIYDQVGGGFHRYSTDERWLIPHFEKMLYDNALLPPLYLAAYQITGYQSYASIVHETLEYVLREMTHSEGGFFSAQDADSEGEEGKFYVWRPEELRAILGRSDAMLAAARWGVTEEGNFGAGKSVLHRREGIPNLALRFGLESAEIRRKLMVIREKLYEAREKRVRPFRDEKILTAWNALMVTAFARAAFVLGERHYAQAALRGLDFLWEELRFPDGRLRRSWKERPGTIEGFLDDYVFLSRAFLDTYQVTFDRTYLERAKQVMDKCVELFWDETEGGFFLTASGGGLIHRPKVVADQSIPAGNSIAGQVLVRLHSYHEGCGYLTRAERLLSALRPEMESNPWGAATLLRSLDIFQTGLVEVVIVIPRTEKTVSVDGEGSMEHLLHPLRQRYLPNLALHVVDEATAAELQGPAVWCSRRMQDRAPAAYVCHHFSCSAPVTAGTDLEAELSEAWKPAVG